MTGSTIRHDSTELSSRRERFLIVQHPPENLAVFQEVARPKPGFEGGLRGGERVAGAVDVSCTNSGSTPR